MRMRMTAICVVVAWALVFIPSALAGHAGGLVVRTQSGAVEGESPGGVDQWLGLPYAAPPVGSLRWKSPVPAASWHGVRSAATLPPTCPQLPSGNGPRSENEDCLYLSIYRPARVSRHARLPVLFWIHGGGLPTRPG